MQRLPTIFEYGKDYKIEIIISLEILCKNEERRINFEKYYSSIHRINSNHADRNITTQNVISRLLEQKLQYSESIKVDKMIFSGRKNPEYSEKNLRKRDSLREEFEIMNRAHFRNFRALPESLQFQNENKKFYKLLNFNDNPIDFLIKEETKLVDCLYYEIDIDEMLDCQIKISVEYKCSEDYSEKELNLPRINYEGLVNHFLEEFEFSIDHKFGQNIMPKNYEILHIKSKENMFHKVPAKFFEKRMHLFGQLYDCIDSDTIGDYLCKFPWDFNNIHKFLRGKLTAKIAYILSEFRKVDPLKLIETRQLTPKLVNYIVIRDIMVKMDCKIEGYKEAYKELYSEYLKTEPSFELGDARLYDENKSICKELYNKYKPFLLKI